MLAPSRQSAGTSRTSPLPAPALGWNTRDPLAAMEPGYAPVYDNVVTEGGSPRVRRGWRVWSTGLPGRVDGLLSFTGAGATEALFAASSSGIYAITAGGAVGAAAVSGLTSARWDGINFAASGGNYLFCWNGADTERTYSGSAWASWGGTGVTGRVIWAHAVNGRLFVGAANRLSFYYGGAGAIGGSFTEFPLQGIAGLGGYVVAATTLSGDGGAGPQNLTVFLTSEGEAIVYAGTDPSSIASWSLVGRWRLPRPIGAPHRCVTAYGGDVLVLTDAGVVPLSAFRSGADVATIMDRAAITRTIPATWRTLANERRSSSGWGVTPLTRYGHAVVNVPWSATDAQQIVLSDGAAISRWQGIPAAVWAEGLGGRVFCGDATATGRVFLWGEDTTDNANGIRSEIVTAYQVLRTPGRTKRAQMVQPILRDADGITLTCQVLTDWRVPVAQVEALGADVAAPSVPPLTSGLGYLVWGVDDWDEALWAGGDGPVISPRRTSMAIGQAMAVRLALISGNGRPALLGVNLIHELGGPVGG
jgi:hypothetical protein